MFAQYSISQKVSQWHVAETQVHLGQVCLIDVCLTIIFFVQLLYLIIFDSNDYLERSYIFYVLVHAAFVSVRIVSTMMRPALTVSRLFDNAFTSQDFESERRRMRIQ
jgi:hypothetical protein